MATRAARPSSDGEPRRRKGRRGLALAASAALAVAATPVALALTAGAANATVPAAPSGWTTVFSDDFSGAAGTGLNRADWLYDLGHSYPGGAWNWGTGQVEAETDSTANVYQDGAGHLVIKPIRASDGTWTSGRVETQRTDFAAPAGGQLEMVAALKQPDPANGLGYWPAFWALGDAARANGATSWPTTGEIDIMEDVNARSQVAQTLHCGTGSGGPCNETIGLGSGLQDCAGCQTSYHTYAAVIDRRNTSAEQLRFYVDGALTSTVTQAQVGTATWQQAIDRGYFMILNVAMGGAFPDALCGCSTAASLGSTTSGAGMSVDYVAVYQQGGGSTSTPPPTSPTTPPTTTPPASGVPAAPTNLHVTATTSTSVTTAWNASSGATSYRVLRAGVPIATATGTSFTDANLNPSTPYLYSVQAVNSAGTSAESNQISVTTPATGSTGGSTGTPSPTPTPTGGGSSGGVTATSTIQAEAYAAQQGTTTETTTDTGGGKDVASIANGDWLRYDNVDFGSSPLHVLKARVASGAAGGVSGLVQVRLDSLTAAPIGSFALANTGGWQSWRTIPGDVSGVTGKHTVYLTFSSGQPADYVNVNWFTFSAS
ncbi:carbohydrate-binding protein [Cellulomonas alba]|uniref:Carbohydrate-binding protein n=1 Tax=Cellulomonas alba TaxID=3053467 RepID=A0ABT7SFI0_9CELL|nr:carbohydrate-binding protein [Cellulomonas alba]MDM7854881.1 carbohydrate-binding protein [Cellulomonas alba]